MRIVVSGATGFLGGHLCARLKAEGHEVLALGRNPDKGAQLKQQGIRFEAIDLGAIAAVRTWAQADAFVHAAALSSVWGPREAFERANVTGTRNALVMAKILGAGRFVFISSPSVGFRFKDQLNVRESAPLPMPVNDYAATKVIAEDLVRGSGLNTIILRPRGLYGPGDAALLPRLLRAAKARPLPLLRKGAALTDLTFIDDAVEAVLLALMAPAEYGGRTYNISGGEAVPMRDILTQTAAAAGIPVRFRRLPVAVAMAAARLAETVARLSKAQAEPVITAYAVGVLAFSQTLDLTAAYEDLGFTPRVTFAEGLRRTFP